MSCLSDKVLTGVQGRWRTLTKDLSRSKQASKLYCGRWMQRQSVPQSLLEAERTFQKLLAHLKVKKEETWLTSLRGTVSGLLQAIKSAESRDGCCGEALAESMLEGSIPVSELLEQGKGYSLCHCLPREFLIHTPSALVARSAHRATGAYSGGNKAAGVV